MKNDETDPVLMTKHLIFIEKVDRLFLKTILK